MNVDTYSVYPASTGTVIAFLMSVVAVFLFFVPQTHAEDTATSSNDTYAFILTKNISDNIQPDGYTADQFSFLVVGNGYNEVVTLSPFTDDTAVGSVMLPVGNYTLTEMGPPGFVPADWTVKWAGYGCDNTPVGMTTTMTVTADDASANVCDANNQWRPSTASSTPVYGCTDVSAENYNPAATVDDASCTYAAPKMTYLIDGYVWHDANENGQIDETETFLEGWQLQLVNGSTTLQTQSDAFGYFSFEVTEGVWTLSEVLEEGWMQVYPTPTTYVINVPEDFSNQQMAISFPLSLFFKVAQAQAPVSGGPYNFGNVFVGSGGGGTPTPVSCTLDASNTLVQAGDTVTLTWSTSGASVVTIDNGIGSVSTTGSTTVTISGSTQYTLTADGGSDSAVCTVQIRTRVSSGGGHGRRLNRNTPDTSSTGNDPVTAPQPVPRVLGEQVTIVPAGAPNAGAGGGVPQRGVMLLWIVGLFVSLLAIFLTRKST